MGGGGGRGFWKLHKADLRRGPELPGQARSSLLLLHSPSSTSISLDSHTPLPRPQPAQRSWSGQTQALLPYRLNTTTFPSSMDPRGCFSPKPLKSQRVFCWLLWLHNRTRHPLLIIPQYMPSTVFGIGVIVTNKTNIFLFVIHQFICVANTY